MNSSTEDYVALARMLADAQAEIERLKAANLEFATAIAKHLGYKVIRVKR